MPRARTHRALVPCLGCGRPSPTSRCPTCAPTYDATWANISKAARQAQPWCSRCGSPGPLETDHVDPGGLAGGIQVLCTPCHHDKTAGQGGWARDGNVSRGSRTPLLDSSAFERQAP